MGGGRGSAETREQAQLFGEQTEGLVWLESGSGEQEGVVGREIRGTLETRGVWTLFQVQWETFKTMRRFKTEVQ